MKHIVFELAAWRKPNTHSDECASAWVFAASPQIWHENCSLWKSEKHTSLPVTATSSGSGPLHQENVAAINADYN